MNILSLVLLAFSTLLIASLFQPKGLVMSILLVYLFSNLILIETGYILSFCKEFSNLYAWVFVFAIIIIIGLFAVYWFSLDFPDPDFDGFELFGRVSIIEKTIFALLAVGIFSILTLNLMDILFAAPQNTDALTYHLARVGYYLQHGTMQWYPANQWPQVVHPKNSSSLFAFLFLVSNFEENHTQWPQYLSYIILLVSVYGICRQLKMTKYSAWISALISLLPICLVLGSTTNQNDLLITSFAACAMFFMLTYKNEKHWKYLLLFAISVALMTGFKASAIMVYPVLGMVVLFSFYENFLILKFKDFILLIIFCLGSFLILTLSSGYWENFMLYGNPIGPEHMRKEHNFEGLPIDQILYQGSKNVFRYLANFFCFDGFLDGPKIFYDANSILWKGITLFFENCWPDIYSLEYTRLPFGTFKKISSDEEKVFFGPVGFLLMLPFIVWGFVHGVRQWKKSPDGRITLFLSIACIVFLFSQSFFGQFDPWRGRMFGTMVLFAAPICGIWWANKSHSFLPKIYFTAVVLISCWAGIWSILFRYESSWIKPNYTNKTLFKMSRMEQLMRDLPFQYAPYNNFDRLVPQNAKVVSWLIGSYPEYVLFGEKLTRKVYTKAEQTENKIQAEYIIFDSQQFKPQPNDVALGEGLFLRKLNL